MTVEKQQKKVQNSEYDAIVAVPTYWMREGNPQTFDHPTSIGGESTLPRLLRSLEIQKNSPKTLLVLAVATTEKNIANDAYDRVREVVEKHPSLPTLIFGQRQLEISGLEGAANFLNLQTYHGTRNLINAIGAMYALPIIGLDDDEIVHSQWVRTIYQTLGTIVDDTPVLGLAGFYQNAEGSRMLDEHQHPQTIFDRKPEIMNRGTRSLEEKPGHIVQTPFAFGGNFTLHPDMFNVIGYDPGVPRGEDTDYVGTAMVYGIPFYMATSRSHDITHLPPTGGSYKDATRRKAEADVRRYIYESAKLASIMGMLYPFPGEIIAYDPELFDSDAIKFLQTVGTPDPHCFIQEARAQVPQKIEASTDFTNNYRRIISEVSGQNEYLEREVINRRK